MGYSAGDLQVGFGSESTWNTAVAATRTIEVTSENIKATYDRLESKGLRTQRVLASKDKFTKGKVDVSGDIEYELQTRSIGMLFGHALGATVSTATAAGGTAAKTHTYAMTAGKTTDGMGLTTQIVRTGISGQQVFTYSGCKVQSWELQAAQNEICTAKLTLDGAAETVGAGSGAFAKQAAAYGSASVPLVFAGASVSVAGSVLPCKSISIKGDNQLKTDRYNLGSLTKKEQLQTGMRTVTGQIGLELDDIAAYNRVVNADVVAFEAKFESLADIETGVKASVLVTIPSIRFEGETPNGGGQIVDYNLSFVALDDETDSSNPVTIAYTTLDTTP